MKILKKKLFFRILFFFIPLIFLIYILSIYFLIRLNANKDEAQIADIIVVFGAAQYNGQPSPVFKARLDHSINLFKKKFAKQILTTGGHGLDLYFSEAEVGKSYLIKQNIPKGSIFTETKGLSTLESVEKILIFLEIHKMDRVIAVSDGFHLFRIKKIFYDNQIIAFGSPALNSPIEANYKRRFWSSLREVGGFTVYCAKQQLDQVISYFIPQIH